MKQITNFNFLVNEGDYNYDGLMDIINHLKIKLYDCDTLIPGGLALEDKIFIDVNGLIETDERLLFFVICHEISHTQSIKKMGVAKMLSDLAIKDFKTFSDKIINEEIVADRFGRLLFFKLNSKLFPYHLTQKLETEYYVSKYKDGLLNFHGLNDGTMETYNKLIKKFLGQEVDIQTI